MKLRSIFPFWNLFEYALLRGVSALINALPIEASTRLARGIGDLVFTFYGSRRKVLLSNLDKAYGNKLSPAEKEKLGRKVIRNLATSLMEFFRIPSMLKEAAGRFEFEGTEHLDQAFARGKGLIFVISHLGSWEYLAFLPYLRKYPCSVVVRPTKNPYVYPWIQNLRIQTQLNPIDKKNSARQILSELKKNHLVAILIDQWAGPDGLWIDFFGHATSTTSIPARLAKKTGAALVPGYCIRTAVGKYKIMIQPEVPLDTSEDWEKKTTEELNQLLEKEILKNPAQWIWGHKRWKDKSRFRSTPP